MEVNYIGATKHILRTVRANAAARGSACVSSREGRRGEALLSLARSAANRRVPCQKIAMRVAAAAATPPANGCGLRAVTATQIHTYQDEGENVLQQKMRIFEPCQLILLEAGRQLKVHMKSRSDCRLAISYLPWFSYNAEGGGGWGTATRLASGLISLRFPAESLKIPSLESSTSKIKGVPLPPGIEVAIHPTCLEGWLDPRTGEMQLRYDAQFELLAPLYRPPLLEVHTLLTTKVPLPPGSPQELSLNPTDFVSPTRDSLDSAESLNPGSQQSNGAGVQGPRSKPPVSVHPVHSNSNGGPSGARGGNGSITGERRKPARDLRGKALDAGGRAVLVGAATVAPTGDVVCDTVLRLPAQALAVMSAEFRFY